nr:hypothetical protein [Tanacetum cinerariifolium]
FAPIPNPEDITDPTTAMNMALALMAKAFKQNYSTPTNNNQRISSNPKNKQIAQPARPRRRDAAYLQTQLLIAQKEEAGIQLQAEEYDLMAAAADLDEIEKVNANCILMANLQQASSSVTQTDSTPIYDSDGSAENSFYLKQAQKKQQSLYDGKVLLAKHDPIVVHDSEETLQLAQENFKSLAKEANASLAKHKILELDIERLLKAVVGQDIISVVQNAYVVDTSDLQTELEPYNDMQQKIERLQAQLGDLKGKSKDTSCVSDTQTQLSQKLENANVELEFQLFKKVSDQKDNTQDTSKNTKFAKQPIAEILPKIGETNALSNPVTSNSVSTPQEPKGVNNDTVIAPGMFRISPDKVLRKAKKVPNILSASARTKPIIVSQPSVITKKDMNSDLNGFSSTGVDNTKTRRPQPRSNTKNDRVPSASKCSRNKNKEAEVEEHHRNLLLSTNNKHMSSACNNSKFDSPDVITKVVCAMCKKCLISVNHDVCLNC